METCLTMEELLMKFHELTPFLDDKVEDMLRRQPDLLRINIRAGDADVQAGRLVGAAILDFIAWAYGRPELGYVPPSEGDE